MRASRDPHMCALPRLVRFTQEDFEMAVAKVTDKDSNKDEAEKQFFR